MGFDSWDLYNVGEQNLYPGPVDNSGLFSGKTSIRLKKKKKEEEEIFPLERVGRVLQKFILPASLLVHPCTYPHYTK